MTKNKLFQQDLLFLPARSYLRELHENAHFSSFWVIDETVDRLHGVSDWHNSPFLIIKAEENRKNVELSTQIWKALTDYNVQRHHQLIAVGGGITADIAGFVASTYMRGLPMISVPTTLLAQVDAAIGGKTGVNLGQWKNRIGSFYPAHQIILDHALLKSLPDEEWVNGWAEILKQAIIGGQELSRAVMHYTTPASSRSISETLLAKIIQVKVKAVQADPYDVKERRKLNAGHTVGHAIESISLINGSAIPHGLAVAAGLWIELEIARNEDLLAPEVAIAIQQYIHDFFSLPKLYPHQLNDIIKLMGGDKKNMDDRINCSLVCNWGRVVENHYPKHTSIEQGLRSYFNAMENS